MSKTRQTPNRPSGSVNSPLEPTPVHVLSDAEVRDAIRRGRRMQARAIASLFGRLGK